MNLVVELVFLPEEGLAQVGAAGLSHAPVQGHNVAAGAECLVAFRLQPDRNHPFILGPRLQAGPQQSDHVQ